MADPSESSAALAGAPPPSRPAPASAPQAGTAFGAVGKPLRRADGRAKVTGETRFADDLSVPGMLFMKLKRSSVPHARILEVDAAAALAVPGVRPV